MGWFRSKSKSSNATQYRVMVPDNVKPGDLFHVNAGNRIVRVPCPIDAQPGQWLLITVPAGPQDPENVWKVEGSDPSAFRVRIPKGTKPGEKFPVTVGWQKLLVTCPKKARAGMIVRFVPPPLPFTPPTTRDAKPTPSAADATMLTTQMFEVLVPQGVTPGSIFTVMAGGVRVLIRCPKNASPGNLIRFKLPLKRLLKKRAQIQTTRLSRMKLLGYRVRSFFSTIITKCMCHNRQRRTQEEEEERTANASISMEGEGSSTWELESVSID